MTFFRTPHLLCLALCLAGSHVRADVINGWNSFLLDTFANIGQSATPTGNARSLAIMSVSMYEAVNSVDQAYTPYLSSYQTYSGTVDTRAAAAQAARDSVVNLYGGYSGVTAGADALLASQLGAMGLSPSVQADSLALGSAAAAAILSHRSADGYGAANTYTPQAAGTPGAWQPGVIPNPSGWGTIAGTFLQSEAGYMTPWAMSSSTQFRPGPPPALGSAQYAVEFNQVKDYGSLNSSLRSVDQTNVARFWMDGPGTESPPGHWNTIAQSVSSGLDFDDKARLFALLNIANADAAIATWDAKRHYDSWRPNQAIWQADIDGNPLTDQDLSWAPLIGTPSFPAYSSGHAAFSQASADILEMFFGTDNIAFTTTSEYPAWVGDPLAPSSRSFTSFEAAADEAGMSRIYGGIHFASDNTAGQQIGGNVASLVYGNLLLPVPEPSGVVLLLSAGLGLSLRRRRPPYARE
jgi:hypothetical protein